MAAATHNTKVIGTVPPTNSWTGFTIGGDIIGRKIYEVNLPTDYLLTGINVYCRGFKKESDGHNNPIIRVYQDTNSSGFGSVEVGGVGFWTNSLTLEIKASLGEARKVIIDAYDNSDGAANSATFVGTVSILGRPLVSAEAGGVLV